MLEALLIETNKTLTENGAVTYASTGSDCLDLFASIGAMRDLSDEEIWTRFYKAFCENKLLAMKILFYARDIRGGIGERKVFRIILKNLAEVAKSTVTKNMMNIPEFGRYDDMLELLDTPCEKDMLACIDRQLQDDLANLETEAISLLAKWLPSVNASNEKTVIRAKKIAKALSFSEKEYRQLLTKVRAKIKIIENNLREKDYTFAYEKQTSKSMFKYRSAFIRNDSKRYFDFLRRVQTSEVKLNTETLYPYEVVRSLKADFTDEMREALDVTWNNLPDYTNNENALVVLDGSGSMYWGGNPKPVDVALSLAIYFAERNKGTFHNHFITFSEKPRLVKIKGEDIFEKVKYCVQFNQAENTNIEKVFKLILSAAIKNAVPQEQMPATVYIISDMEFDCCTNDASLTNFENVQKQFQTHGYALPKLVFWNVHSMQQQVPVTQNEQGVVLVSGCSPKIFEMVVSGETSPYAFMMRVINAERYDKIQI